MDDKDNEGSNEDGKDSECSNENDEDNKRSNKDDEDYESNKKDDNADKGRSKGFLEDLKGVLYPCVGLNSQGSSVKVNFGYDKFKYTGIFI